MRIALLHNPSAGDQELSKDKLMRLIRREGYQPAYFSLKETAWKKKNELQGAEFVVVAGGDGAVRKAVLQLHDRGLPFALLPLGTANNICTSLGISGKPKEIIAGWSKASRRKIDLGVASGPWGKEHFIESAGFGLIGRTINIMTAVDAATGYQFPRREDRLHHASSIVLTLAHELQPVRLATSWDGRRASQEDYLLFDVMNINRVGPGLNLAPEADPSDGVFNVTSATLEERERLKRSLAHALNQANPKAVLRHRKIRSLHVELSDGEFRVDDDIVWRGTTKPDRRSKRRVAVDISILPSAVQILVPRVR